MTTTTPLDDPMAPRTRVENGLTGEPSGHARNRAMAVRAWWRVCGAAVGRETLGFGVRRSAAKGGTT